jgi:hypothetical protein
MSLDLEVSVNGRRLKEGPYTTLMRPARLDPAKSLLIGAGMHGAQPGEEQVLLLQLMNELSENMTTCSSSAAQEVVGVAAKTSVKCVTLSADMCKLRADCEWIPVDGAVGVCVCMCVCVSVSVSVSVCVCVCVCVCVFIYIHIQEITNICIHTYTFTYTYAYTYTMHMYTLYGVVGCRRWRLQQRLQHRKTARAR